jgi:hypothetical protein
VTKPPRCAKYATPPDAAVAWPRLPSPFPSWITNQTTITMNAGMAAVSMTKKMKISVMTRALG